MNQKVIIIGAGGHSKAIADVIVKSGDLIVGFLDDTPYKQDCIVYNDKRVLGTICEDVINKYLDCYFIIAIGDNKARKHIAERFPYLKWYTAIDPSAVIGSNVSIGEGTAIMTGVFINYGVKVGKLCIINTCSSLAPSNPC